MRRLTLLWELLVGLAFVSWWSGHHLHAAWVPLVVLGLTALKGQVIIDWFMELAHAPRLFRYVVGGWLWGVLTAIAVVGDTGISDSHIDESMASLETWLR